MPELKFTVSQSDLDIFEAVHHTTLHAYVEAHLERWIPAAKTTAVSQIGNPEKSALIKARISQYKKDKAAEAKAAKENAK